MCNEAARRIALGLIREDWATLRVPLRFPEGLPNLEATDSVRITDRTLILRADPDGAKGVVRRWSWPGAGGKPVYNFRSEGRAFGNGEHAGRCLMPVDGFYEFTEPAPGLKRKTKWRFTDAAHPWFCIAGWWRAEPALGDGAAGEAFTMLTCAPGPDIAPYHHRQVVLPPREQWAGWLDGSLPAAEVCRPAAAGRFTAERVG